MQGQSAKRKVQRTWLITTVVLLACGGERAPANDSTTTAPPPTAVADTAQQASLTAALPPGTSCPEHTPWRACSVEQRINRAGLAVKRRDEGVKHDWMHVEGIVWETSRAEIQVFLYPTEADRKRDTDGLDTVMVAPRGERIVWRWPATLVTSQNMAAIVLSLNGRQSERIALALGAGLPPAPR